MKVSIIIPVYKVEDDIEACVASVIGQTHQNLEVILVDDCGGDASMEKAERLLETTALEWKAIRHEGNKGPSAARNSGAHAAGGDFIFFLDADDVLMPDALAHLLTLVEHSGADVAAASASALYPDGSQRSGGYGSISSDYVSTHPLQALYAEDIYTAPWNKLINRSFYLQSGLRFAEGILYEDEPWVLELALKARKVAFSSRETYGYRQRAHSITHAGRVHLHAAVSSARQIRLFHQLIHQYGIELNDAFNVWYLKRFIACAMRIHACRELGLGRKIAMLRDIFSCHYPTGGRLTEDKIILVTNIAAGIMPRHLAFMLSAWAYSVLKPCISRR